MLLPANTLTYSRPHSKCPGVRHCDASAREPVDQELVASPFQGLAPARAHAECASYVRAHGSGKWIAAQARSFGPSCALAGPMRSIWLSTAPPHRERQTQCSRELPGIVKRGRPGCPPAGHRAMTGCPVNAYGERTGLALCPTNTYLGDGGPHVSRPYRHGACVLRNPKWVVSVFPGQHIRGSRGTSSRRQGNICGAPSILTTAHSRTGAHPAA